MEFYERVSGARACMRPITVPAACTRICPTASLDAIGAWIGAVLPRSSMTSRGC